MDFTHFLSELLPNLQAVRAKIDSNPVGALQELCQKVKVIPFYQEVVGAPRHTVQVTKLVHLYCESRI